MLQHLLRRRSVLLAVASSSLIASSSLAGTTPIYGGPSYDSTTQSGAYTSGLAHNPGSSAGNGVGLNAAEVYGPGHAYLGDRAYRWTSSGSVLQLGTLGTDSFGFTLAMAYAINPSNVSVGAMRKFSGDESLGFRAVRWNAAGAATELGALGVNNSVASQAEAYAINRSGAAVGYGYKPQGNGDIGFRAIRWDASGTAATELGNLGTESWGYGEARAYAINTAGTAIGYSRKYVGGALRGARAVRWNAGSTTATELGNLGTNTSGSANNEATAINDAGTAVGFAYKFVSGNTSVGMRAVRWNAGGTAATELTPINTDGTGYSTSEAKDINGSGVVVGYSAKYSAAGADLGNRAVRWNAGSTTAVELANLGVDSSGYSDNYANAVNSSGIAVGMARHPTLLDYHAAVWDTDGKITDLNSLLVPGSGWTLYEAADVTDAGWITITGSFDPDGGGSRPAYTRSGLMLVPAAGTYGIGDADFDAAVGFSDLTILAQHYNQSNPTRATGVADFDLNGTTNFNDLVMLSQHYNTSSVSVESLGGAGFAADWALAQSLVPEPSAAFLLLSGAGFARRNRSR